MQTKVTVALVGDYDDSVPAHLAIPHALKRAADTMQIEVDFEWIPTVEIASVSRIASFDGIWCVPASPYQNMEGALLAIRHARESATPFLGTCGDFSMPSLSTLATCLAGRMQNMRKRRRAPRAQ